MKNTLFNYKGCAINIYESGKIPCVRIQGLSKDALEVLKEQDQDVRSDGSIIIDFGHEWNKPNMSVEEIILETKEFIDDYNIMNDSKLIDLDKYSVITIDGVDYMAIKARYFKGLKTAKEAVEYLDNIFNLGIYRKGLLKLSMPNLIDMVFAFTYVFDRKPI